MEEIEILTAWIPAAIIAAASLAGGWIQNRSNKKAQEKAIKAQNKAQMELAEYQFAQNKDMWQTQNEYNAPGRQMQRLESAGLNPNLVYGSNAPGNQSGSAPTYEAPKMHSEFSPMQIPDMLQHYQSFQMHNAQIDNVRAQTENIEERTRTEGINQILRGYQSGTAGLTYEEKSALAPHFKEMAELKRDQSRAGLNETIQRIRNLSAAEQNQILQQQYKKNAIDQQAIDKEIKQARLLFEQHRNEFRKDGIMDGDNIFLRLMIRMLNDMNMNPFDHIKGMFSK